jgi:hypothetical protein
MKPLAFVALLGSLCLPAAAAITTVSTVDDGEFLVTTPGVFSEQAGNANGITLNLVEGTANGEPFFQTGTRFGIMDFSLASVPAGATITGAVVTVTVNNTTGTVANPAALRTRVRAGDGVVGFSDALAVYTPDVFTNVTAAGPIAISLNALLPEVNLIADNADFITVYTAIAYGNTGESARFNSLETAVGVPQLTVTYDLAIVPEPTSLALLSLGGLALLRRRQA